MKEIIRTPHLLPKTRAPASNLQVSSSLFLLFPMHSAIWKCRMEGIRVWGDLRATLGAPGRRGARQSRASTWGWGRGGGGGAHLRLAWQMGEEEEGR